VLAILDIMLNRRVCNEFPTIFHTCGVGVSASPLYCACAVPIWLRVRCVCMCASLLLICGSLRRVASFFLSFLFSSSFDSIVFQMQVFMSSRRPVFLWLSTAERFLRGAQQQHWPACEHVVYAKQRKRYLLGCWLGLGGSVVLCMYSYGGEAACWLSVFVVSKSHITSSSPFRYLIVFSCSFFG